MTLGIRAGLVATVLGVAALGSAGGAVAQQSACVYLQPGAGYAGKMRITWGNGSSTSWSKTFRINGHACQALAGSVPANAPYSVQVHANAGKTKTCTPAGLTYLPNQQGNAVWNAWGTTLNVKCQQQQ